MRYVRDRLSQPSLDRLAPNREPPPAEVVAGGGCHAPPGAGKGTGDSPHSRAVRRNLGGVTVYGNVDNVRYTFPDVPKVEVWVDGEWQPGEIRSWHKGSGGTWYAWVSWGARPKNPGIWGQLTDPPHSHTDMFWPDQVKLRGEAESTGQPVPFHPDFLL